MARDTLVKDSVGVAADAISDHAEAVRNGHSQSKPNEGEWNPFVGADVIFASERPPQRFDFTIHGKPAFVEVRMMGADACERFQGTGRELYFNENTAKTREARVETDTAKQKMMLLLESVTDFQLWRKDTTQSGGEQFTVIMAKDGSGKLLPKHVLEQIYKDLSPPFHRMMVEACVRVNGLDPFE